MATVARFFADHVLSTPGVFRMVATVANSQPAFVAYQRADDGTYQPHAVHLLGQLPLTLDTSGVAHIAVFREPTICRLFTR